MPGKGDKCLHSILADLDDHAQEPMNLIREVSETIGHVIGLPHGGSIRGVEKHTTGKNKGMMVDGPDAEVIRAMEEAGELY